MMMSNKNLTRSFWQIVGADYRHFKYLTFSSLVLMINALPVWSSLEIYPHFYLYILYFGTLYYPPMLSLGSIFIAGLIQDGIYGYPLGFSSLEFLCLHCLLLSQSQYLTRGDIQLSWIGFCAFCISDAFLHSLILSYTFSHSFSFSLLSLGRFLTICAYPLSLKLLYTLSKKIG
jgi:rod shape-determining protein MreD